MGVYVGDMPCPKCGTQGRGQVNTSCGTDSFFCQNEACGFFFFEEDGQGPARSSDPEFEEAKYGEFISEIVRQVMPEDTPDIF